MTDLVLPDRPLSIWDPVHLGTDEIGQPVRVSLSGRNMLFGGEPGSGKSVGLQLPVAHGALSPDCKLILIDGKRSNSACGARPPTGSSAAATGTAAARSLMTRSTRCAGCKTRSTTGSIGCSTTRSGRSPRIWGGRCTWCAVDEIAYFSATAGNIRPAERVRRAQPRRGRPRPRPRHHRRRSDPAPLSGHHPHLAAGLVRVPVGVPLLHRSQQRHHPGPRVGVQGLHRRRHRPPSPRRRLASCRGRHSPPRSRPPTSPTTTSSPSPTRPPRMRAATKPADAGSGTVIPLREGDAA